MFQIATLEHGPEDRDEHTKAALLRGARPDQPRTTDAGNHRDAASTTGQPIQTGQAVSGVETLTAVTATRPRFWRGDRGGIRLLGLPPDLRRDRGPRSRRDPPASACTTTRPRECIRNREGDKCPDEPARLRGNTRRAAGVTSPIPSAPVTPERCGHVEQGTLRCPGCGRHGEASTRSPSPFRPRWRLQHRCPGIRRRCAFADPFGYEKTAGMARVVSTIPSPTMTTADATGIA